MPEPADLIPELAALSTSKIVLVVMDGLGGVRTQDRASELSEAKTPSLDALAAAGMSGVHTVVAPGITPGSGAGHLALFGYDPLVFELGRGALSAAGVGFALKAGDVAARVNFCTLDSSGNVLDRRAGRLSTEENQRLCAKILAECDLGGRAELSLQTERDHRALLVLRGDNLSPQVSDTDPQLVGVPPREPSALAEEAAGTAAVVADLLSQVGRILAGESANHLLLRGFDTLRPIPSFKQRYLLDAFGAAGYPMYLGIARLLGMTVAPATSTFDEQVAQLESNYDGFDYFYLHHKKTDSAGEDGDFDSKVAAIEEVDQQISRIADLAPDVLCITGDHATPSPLRGHSWHPVPFLMLGQRVGVDATAKFDEESSRQGGFGHILAKDLMALMMAAAGRLTKFGA